jgi:Flp pilus assembly protein TadG
MPPTTRPERGSAATELAIAAPAILLLLLLIVVANQAVTARQDINTLADAAARAASLQRTPTTARAAAAQAAQANLADARITCAHLSVDVDTSAFTPGGSVTATLTCTMDNSHLAAGLHIPGATTLTGHSTSPIDPWRGVTGP